MKMSTNPTTHAEKNREKWRTFISEWEASGLKQSEFCENRGLDTGQFSYYRKILTLKPAQPEMMRKRVQTYPYPAKSVS